MKHSVMAAELTAQEQRDLKEVFAVYDPADTGYLQLKDFRKALAVLGFKCSRQQALQHIRDQQMGIDLDGFLQVVVSLQGTDYDNLSELEQAFSLLDRNGDSFLSEEDLKIASRRAGLRLTEEEVKGLIAEADHDGDGLVSLQEFVTVMMKTPLFNKASTPNSTVMR